MNRRTYLASTATGLLGLGTGIVFHGSESAQANLAMGSLDLSNDSTTNSDGIIEDVTCTVSGQWSYELPGGNPSEWIVDLRVSDGDVWTVVGTQSDTANYAQYEDEYTVTGALVQDGPFDQSYFSAPGPGEQKTVELPFEVRFQVIESDETVLANASIEDTATVTVGQNEINAELYGEIGGTGNVQIED